MQSDVTGKIVATLIGYEGAVAEAERTLLRPKPPANLSAFDTYLLAMEAKHKVTKESLTEQKASFVRLLASIRNWPELTWGWSMSNAI